MTNEQINIAIAEACGWKHIAFNRGWVETGDGETQCVIPNYCNDLNAMHEAEKMLRKPMKGSDTDTIIGDRMHKYAELIGYAFDAPAKQRAEAFLRTIGKWEDAK
jgi:hypothetical protein